MRRRIALAVAALAACAAAAVGVSPAQADGPEASIDHSELDGQTLKMLVSVPGDADVDLGSIAVTIDGHAAEATAETATGEGVSRTAVLAIDTSNSMRGARIAGAVQAASVFLDTVPDDVRVGIVTFDNAVRVRQEPSLDRAATKAVLGDLDLRRDTALYDGVDRAVSLTGDDHGQRQVLVLSDGRDNTGASLDPLLASIRKSAAKVDVVALGQGDQALAALTAMTDAGHGSVISAGAPAELRTAFESEAVALARQVLVTATVPAAQTAKDATVEVSLAAGEQTYDGSAYIGVRSSQSQAAAALPASSSGPVLPTTLMYAGVAAIGIGALGLVGALLLRPREERVPLSDQLEAYGAAGRPARSTGEGLQLGSLTAQAKAAAQKALANNRGLEAKVAYRLDGAGLAMKPAEWLLLHLGIAFGSGILGLALGGGNPLAMVLFLVLGGIGPWVYLGMRRTKRLKAFDAALADTLQLMAGSLSAGLSLAQSLDTIVSEGNEPVASEFKRVIVEARLGVGIEDALEGVADRMDSKDFQWVVMAIRIQREVGGNLSELLLNVASTLREREYLRRHVRALSAEGRLSCWLLGALPPVFLVYLVLTKPDYVNPLFTTPLGIMMCVGMAVLLSVGIFWMSRLVKVEV